MNLQGVYLGQQKYRFFNLFRFLHSLIYFLGIVFLFAVNSENISNYVALFLLSQALATLPLIKPLAQFTFGKFELKYVKLILKKGSLFYLPFLLAVYSTQWDLLVVVKQLNFEEIGLYQAAYTIANGSTLIISLTFQYLVFPIATRLSHQNERALFIVENYFLAIIGLFLLAGLISFSARWIIPILFGQSFLGSVPILQLLVWGYALISSKIVASKSVKALSDGKLSFNIELVYAAIFLLGASSLLWLEIFDLTKLCYLIFISGLISNLYFTFSIKRKYQLRWREIFNIKKAIQRLIKGLS